MGREMKERQEDIDTGTPVFENDLLMRLHVHTPRSFIAMSMAKRKVILVGDHRQLPHLLEPNVTSENPKGNPGWINRRRILRQPLKKAFLKKLWFDLRKLEQ